MVVNDFLILLKTFGLLNYAIRTGVISWNMVDYHNIYKYYLNEKKRLEKERDYRMQAIQNTCEKYGCGKSKVYKAISQMTRK